jgi:hypothetical protein
MPSEDRSDGLTSGHFGVLHLACSTAGHALPIPKPFSMVSLAYPSQGVLLMTNRTTPARWFAVCSSLLALTTGW